MKLLRENILKKIVVFEAVGFLGPLTKEHLRSMKIWQPLYFNNKQFIVIKN